MRFTTRTLIRGNMKIGCAFLGLTIALSPVASGTSHSVVSSGFTFSPDSLSIHPGDTVNFQLAGIHTSRQVSQSTWMADDTTSNGGWDLPLGGGTVVLDAAGTYYYVCVPHASMGMKGRIFVVAAPESILTVHRNVTAGWNMVSLPVEQSDTLVTTLFPGADSHAFAYEGGYTTAASVTRGTGYWLKFTQTQDVQLTGHPIVRESVLSSKGWNMIGSLSFRRAHTSLSSSPPGIINSPIFGFNGAYVVADTIVPGEGYWVRLNASGTLIFDTASSVAFPMATADKEFLRTAALVSIRDAANHEGTLYIADNRTGETFYPSFAELPPVPPPGGFDLRFATGRCVALISEGESGDFPVGISSAQYPIAISWDIRHVSERMFFRLDGSSIPLNGVGEIRIANPARNVSLKISSKGSAPTVYSLSEAYPNPFNPGTVVQYTLPVESRVVVRVYNVLGQLVSTLVDAIEGAGERSVAWNADGGDETPGAGISPGGGARSSGVYLIRMDASPVGGGLQPYSRVIKAVLQK